MTKKVIRTKSAEETRRVGRDLAKEILKSRPKRTAFLIVLVGDLGGGKTTFLQGFARGLGIKEKILSPTFVLMKKFKIQNSKFKIFYHIDCYRIKRPKEILDLSWKEIVGNPQNIVAVEWADKILKLIPKNVIWINFEFLDEKTRKITFKIPNSKTQIPNKS